MSLEVVIYLCDNSSKTFTLPNGYVTTSQEYFNLMIKALKLPENLGKKCFALWLKSPLLDVQLKPCHIPYRMLQQWPHFLRRFSMATDKEKNTDEPIMLFRRNAFLKRSEEMSISETSVLNILQMEAKLNIQQGIYPCDQEDLEQLGALVCSSNYFCKERLRVNLAALLPAHVIRPKKGFFKRQESIEDKIVRCVKMKETSDAKVPDPLLEFMKICWQLPYYGSVIFHGIVEKPQNSSSFLTSFMRHQPEIEVYVAINTDGVWIIDSDKKHVLVGLKYNEFNWEVASSDAQQKASNDVYDQIPSLFLEFDTKDGNGKLLQILSKEAPMMSSMIETCLFMLEEKKGSEKNIIDPLQDTGWL